jgi:hypothetical protein
MQSGRKYWNTWSQKLQKWGMRDLAATILEASGPLRIVLAQLVYATSPLFQIKGDPTWQVFADTLDDKQRAREFATYLRENRPEDES